jgi:ribose transport system ATP-binding protein
MIRYMIGRDLKKLYRPPSAPLGPPLIELTGITTRYRPGEKVNLAVRKGEILGLAGLVGSGRTELARTIFGLDPRLGREIRINGREGVITSPRDAIDLGVYLVPEDRKRCGLILDMTIRENITLTDVPVLSRSGLVDEKRENDLAETQIEKLDIRAPGAFVKAGNLSGGNQQKVVLAKWLSLSPKVLICDEPTRGIDVGAKQDIYTMLRVLADAGVAIVMISSDMEEVIGVSDRIAVMHEGRISGVLDRPQFSEHNILTLAVGQTLH